MATNETNESEGSIWTSRSFLGSALVVAVVVILGLALALTHKSSEPSSTATQAPAVRVTASATATSSSLASAVSTAGESDSVCGLEGVVEQGTLDRAPNTEWKYQGTFAYPFSSEYGPAKTTMTGVRYCFQHTPSGAVFAAGNALVQSINSDTTALVDWSKEFVSQGAQRQTYVATLAQPPSDENPRLSIAGFKLLSYQGDTATVEIAGTGSSNGQAAMGSVIFMLRWEDGDWKLDATRSDSLNTAAIDSLDGYVKWGADE